MNYKAIAHYLGLVLKFLAAMLLIPMVIALAYRDYRDAIGFLVTILLLLALGILLGLSRREGAKIYAKEGFVIVALSWVAISFFGALPYQISGEFSSFIDCLFEAVSGFTTTGASVVTDLENLSHGLLFWRGFTHWIGGMGVLVFLMAVVSVFDSDRSVYMMRAESPGPTPGKLVPKLRQSSKILYILYLVLTLLEVLLLLVGGMGLFDSVVTAMSTAGTGGFANHAGSIAAYNSVYIEMVVAVFMALFGVNFNLYYLLLLKNFTAVLKNTEVRAYFGIMLGSIALLTANLTGTVYDTVGRALRFASFQVSSIMTSTGFSSADLDAWPQLSKSVLFVLMFIGACSGSTGGGMKVSRIVILWKESKRSITQIIRPRSVKPILLDGKAIDPAAVRGVCSYAVAYLMIFFLSVLCVSADRFDFESAMSAVACSLNNIGLGFGQAGTRGSFADFSVFSKLTLSMDMLIGRLEIYPMLLLFSPRTWRRVV